MLSKLVSLGIFIKDMNTEGFFLWMQIREDEGALKGYWEFPGGGIEEGESPLKAMQREILEEVGIDISTGTATQFFKIFPYQGGESIIYFHLFVLNNPPGLENKGCWYWIDYQKNAEALQIMIPPANKIMIKELSDHLQQYYQKDIGDLLWV